MDKSASDFVNETNNLESVLLYLMDLSKQIISQSRVETIKTKKDIVTRADLEISTALSSYLLNNIPDVCVETEELGVQNNSNTERYYFAIDDIDGTDNYYRGNNILPYCTCICVFKGRDVSGRKDRERYFSDMIAGCCLEHLSQTIFFAQIDRGIQILGSNMLVKNIDYPVQNYSGDKSTRILTDLYAGKPERLIKLYKSTWVKDFSSSALHYCLASIGLFDGLVFETYKAHELGLAYIFSTIERRWLSDFSLNTYINKPYIFNGSYEVLIAHDYNLALKLSNMIQ